MSDKPKVLLIGQHQHILDANVTYFESFGYSIPKTFTDTEALIAYFASPESKEDGAQGVVVGGGTIAPTVPRIKEAAKKDMPEGFKVLEVPPGTLERVGPPGLKVFIKDELLAKEIGPGVL